MLSSLRRIALLAAVSSSVGIFANAQSGGRLSGKVLDKDGKPMPGVVVIVTDQVTTDDEQRTTRSDGSYSIRLRAGAYRITVRAPYEARFDRAKGEDYGVFANIICDD